MIKRCACLKMQGALQLCPACLVEATKQTASVDFAAREFKMCPACYSADTAKRCDEHRRLLLVEIARLRTEVLALRALVRGHEYTEERATGVHT